MHAILVFSSPSDGLLVGERPYMRALGTELVELGWMMADSNSFLGFLEGLYGRSAIEQIAQVSGVDRKDLEAAGDVLMPVFLEGLQKARSQSHKSPSFGAQSGLDQTPSFDSFWPAEMVDAMQEFTSQSAQAAKAFSASPPADNSAFPFSILGGQTVPMEKLYQAFLGQIAQEQLIREASKKTGIPGSQLKTLFPMLTTYGLMPLMPQFAVPAADDPAGWIDYLGDMGRRNFRQTNRELEALPSPFAAAFDGLLAGFFPKEAAPTPPEPDHAQKVRDANLDLQATYIKGLNSLFETYQAGFSDKTKDSSD